MGNKLNIEKVLRYQEKETPRATVRKYYLLWRRQQVPPIPERCDNPECHFYSNPLIWNNKPFKPILDHVNGNNSDNRVKNLRFLCPNCDSQLDTRGGGNKGRIEKSSGGFAIVREDGKKDYILPAETLCISITNAENQQEGIIISDKDE